jgi:CheY-like chemotaxis protein
MGAASILIAEDNEANIMTISSYLGVKGYQLLVARNGHEAIELAQSSLPDLILMDIQMPGMDGIEAIQKIRQNPELASIPIIAITALAMKGDREKCLTAGANDYISKPIKLKQLNETIQHFLPLPTSVI